MRSPLAWVVAALGLAAAAFVGCSGSSGSLTPGSNPNGQTGGPPVIQNPTSIRVFNGSPDFGPIDVYVDGNRVWQDVLYGTFGITTTVINAPFYVSTFQPTSHNIAVYQAGAAPGTATLQANVTTLPNTVRTTVVVADKQFGILTTPALASIAYTEPTAVSPSGSANVIIHHAALNSMQGVIAYGSLAPNANGNLTIPTCLGTLTSPSLSLPANTATATAKIPMVNSNGNPIGYYAALNGTQNCVHPLAYLDPGSPNPVSSPNPGGFVYPSPAPPLPGQPAPPPFDTNRSLPPTSTVYSQDILQEFVPNNLSIYIVDSPPLPGTTLPVPALVGVFDPNSQ